MTLRPCPSCRRHVREEVCVFCGAAVAASSRLPALAGRLSRAAVFAGATLTGCSSPTAHQVSSPPPPPGDHPAVVVDPTVPADIAAPPPDAAVPVMGTAIIRGTVKYSVKGRHYAQRRIFLIRLAGGATQATSTDGTGRFEFAKLPAGDYLVRLDEDEDAGDSRYGPPPPPQRGVKVADGKTETVEFTITPPVAPPEPVDMGPCCKPYGAPPARRRVV